MPPVLFMRASRYRRARKQHGSFKLEWGVTCLEEYSFDILDIANLLRLTVRRESADSVYVDCPFCRVRRGKLNLNRTKNVWRCNRCGRSGHMFELYAELRGLNVADAKLELADLLAEGRMLEDYDFPGCRTSDTAADERKEPVAQSLRASETEIDRTMREMLGMLTLKPAHLEHLRTVRGLTDEQIQYLGLKSTPSYKLRHTIPRKLTDKGCQITGIPGFFIDKSGKWTVNFYSWTAGILIPVRNLDGHICGAQIRLDHPIQDDPEDPDDTGTKYIWFSSSSKSMGTSSGSPIHFVGDPHARTVYVTEGALKAGIAHCLTARSFLSIQGANNLGGVEEVLHRLRKNGTQMVIEALDTDKFSNIEVARGAQKLYLMARKCGLRCQSLTWNPNYKGIDDWQIAQKRQRNQGRNIQNHIFKEQFLHGCCETSQIEEFVQNWKAGRGEKIPLQDCLGLDEREFTAYQKGMETLEEILRPQRKQQRFRIYQLDFSAGQVIPFAFQGIQALYKAQYQQPPATLYRMVCDSSVIIPAAQTVEEILEDIRARYNDAFPIGFVGRSVAPSDVIELYDQDYRHYYYLDGTHTFVEVRFSPAFCKNRIPADNTGS